MVGLQPGVEEQHLVQEAQTYHLHNIVLIYRAVEMVASYFGLMGVSCAVGTLGGAVLANKQNAAARKELREQYAMDIRDQMIRDSLV
jgi:hypothetical protein